MPDLFPAQEGLTSDDVQARRLVANNEVLRRRVAGRDREGSRSRGKRNGEMEGCVEYSPTVRGRA